MSTIKKFPTDMMDTLRVMIIQDHHPFLLLSRTKQELLVDKVVQRLVSSATLCCHIDLFSDLIYKAKRQKKRKVDSQDFDFQIGRI